MAIPIKFKQANKTFVGPKGSNMMDLPAFNDGQSTFSCWQLSPEELEEVNKTGVIWHSQLAGPNFYPSGIHGISPFFDSPDAMSWIMYEAVVSMLPKGEFVHVVNLTTKIAPVHLDIKGRKFCRVKSIIPVRYYGEPMTKGTFAIAASGEETVAEGMSGMQFVTVEDVDSTGAAIKESAFDIPDSYYK